MNKTDLLYFSVLAETLHFGKAAEKLHITQPPLTRTIKKLEEELGVILFDRNQRNVNLTLAGEYLQKRSNSLLAEFNGLKEEIKKINDGVYGELHITTVGSFVHIILQSYISPFIHKYPNVKLKISQYTTSEQVKLVRSGKADIAFLRGPIFTQGLELHNIYKETFVLITPNTFNKKIEEITDLKEIINFPFISFPRELAKGLFDQIISLCNSFDYQPIIEHETYQLDVAIRMVEIGLGITIVPKSSLYGILADINIFDLDFLDQNSIVSYYFDQNNDNPILKNFITKL